mgnify:CR=1 FL=1
MEDKVIILIVEWQKRWEQHQEIINDFIKVKDFASAYQYQCKATELKRSIQELYSITEAK